MPAHSRRPLRPALVVAAVAAFTSTGAVTAGCSSRSNQYVNCVDDSGRVVDARYCDDDRYYSGGHYYYLPSRTRYRVGSNAPGNWRSGSINPSDSAARTRAGLPSSGHLGGTTVRGGGFGSNAHGSGSSKSGSSSSGHSSSGGS